MPCKCARQMALHICWLSSSCVLSCRRQHLLEAWAASRCYPIIVSSVPYAPAAKLLLDYAAAQEAPMVHCPSLGPV